MAKLELSCEAGMLNMQQTADILSQPDEPHFLPIPPKLPSSSCGIKNVGIKNVGNRSQSSQRESKADGGNKVNAATGETSKVQD